MDSVQERLRHWRQEVRGLSLRQLRDAVNRQLPGEGQVSLGTVANYERPGEPGRARSGPRAEFVAALARAFPELRLDWLLLGEGEPTRLAHAVKEGSALEAIIGHYPDLDLLSPEASAQFTAALTRYAMGDPELAVTETHLLELAGDLRWLLLLPSAGWGFAHEPEYERFSAYAVAMLHALMLAMPGSGRGDPSSGHADSLVPRLRAEHPVGLGGE